jgi:4-amino-4-deoxy-L-arabinose transferase-like glycosyltransferase
MSLIDSAPSRTLVERVREPRLLRWAPWALALLFTLNALRSLPCGNPIDTDAARHAMNGAFLHDLITSGDFRHPVLFGKQYYSRLPGISMPYHPPLFPSIEAAFFMLFGVNIVAARVAVALAVGIGVLLLYRMVLETHRSHAVAAASVLVFFSWRWTQLVSGDVMLEMPALAFALGALWVIRRPEPVYPLWRGLVLAVLAAASVWTKQTAVFLGAVPFAFVLFTRRWRVLARPTIWISSLLFAGLVFALTLLSAELRWTGVTAATGTRHLDRIVLHNAAYYAASLARTTGLAFAIAAAAAAIVAVIRSLMSKRAAGPDALYLSWAFSALGVILVIGVYDERYLFFAVAPLCVITFAAVERLSKLAFGPSKAWLAPVALAAAFAITGLAEPAVFLDGPDDAARAIPGDKPARIVYCGRTNGAFIFSLRSQGHHTRDTVVRGDKLPDDTFTPAAFEDFAHRFGINYIVLERTIVKRRWDPLFDSPTPSMLLMQEIRQPASEPLSDGRLRVYRFTNPSPTPEDTLKFRVKRIGEELEVKF